MNIEELFSLKYLNNTRALGTLLIAAIILAIVVVSVIGIIIINFWIIPGNLITEEKEYSNFTVVDIGSAFKVDIIQSNSFSVNITANENILDKIDVTQEGNTLIIRAGPNISMTSLYEAEIAMPKLTELVISGASKVTAEGFSDSDPIVFEVSGASRLDMQNFHVGNIKIEVSGASTLVAEGSGSDLVSIVEGASRLDLTNFAVNNAEVDVSGASQATINLNGKLDALVSGASSLYYIGQPTMGNIETSGNSTVNKK